VIVASGDLTIEEDGELSYQRDNRIQMLHTPHPAFPFSCPSNF